jgi:hypothetical protein
MPPGASFETRLAALLKTRGGATPPDGDTHWRFERVGVVMPENGVAPFSAGVRRRLPARKARGGIHLNAFLSSPLKYSMSAA